MSLAQEFNELGEYGYIKFTDLVETQKYKVLELKRFTSTLNNTQRNCVRLEIDDGYLILPERYDRKASTIEKDNAKLEHFDLYISFHGRQKGNRFDIRFTEEKKA